MLSNLDLSFNFIDQSFDIIKLVPNKELCTLNLTSNWLNDDEELAIGCLKELPSLRVIYLKQNGIMNKIKNYRKRMLAELPGLTYLEDRPVGVHERWLAIAYIQDGAVGEAREWQLIKDENNMHHWSYLSEIETAWSIWRTNLPSNSI